MISVYTTLKMETMSGGFFTQLLRPTLIVYGLYYFKEKNTLNLYRPFFMLTFEYY